MIQKDIIETERLILRKFREDDALLMYTNWATDPEVTKYLTWDPHPNIEMTRFIISKWMKDYENNEGVRYCITVKGSDEPLGSIDIVNVENGVPEIGYCISRKSWNKGYMTEACKAFIHHLFELGYTKACICAFADNIASNRVIEKCGLKFIKQIEMKIKGKKTLVNYYLLEK